MSITVKVKMLDDNAKMPKRGSEEAAGYDLFVTRYEEDENFIRYYFGLAMKIKKGHFGLLAGRSSNYKMGQMMSGGVCIVDSDYVGELSAVYIKGKNFKRYEVGERPCQIVFMAHKPMDARQVELLPATARGSNGWGSTGR